MSLTHGANVAELQALSAKLKEQAPVIEQIISAGATVETTGWVGPAREAFVGQWETSFLPALNNLETAFEAAGTECANRAAALEAAMGVGGGGGGGGGGGLGGGPFAH